MQVISLTENIEGETGWMMRALIGMFNEQSSRETSKHVQRTRIENAKQGYWNGGKPPIGYMSVPCEETFGDKTKKRLAEDPKWAPTVCLIFRLHREGDGEGHPLGAVGICDYLNRHGYKSRSGGLWHASTVHRILTNEAYVGRVYMNKVNTRTGVERARSEWVYSPAPPLVTEEEFEETQLRLRERCPDRQPPRTTTSDVMLGGIVHCRCCGSAMTAGTGTSRTGKVYSYSVCSGRANKGETACAEPQRVRREDLDERVLNAVAASVLTPERVKNLTNAVAERRRNGDGALAQELEGAKASLIQVDKELDRLVKAVLKGTLMESETVRRNQIDLENEKERLTSIIRLKSSKLKQGLMPIDKDQATQLAEKLRRNLMDAPPQVRRRYVQALVTRVDVGSDEIVIQGPDDAIAEASHPENGGLPPVQSSVREWRRGGDSNPRYP
ncbi:MAG: recombinase family protein [Brevundimonas sp.]|uniref:recombinase family protein n=1 Tax=Brevundimonas sp. TaxID=1871086 RepID=UPI0025C19956|nr:recombinase family protein [Brevundimonas sp.]MBX3476237.1 recombinase family protein [Brevundimonas sp.]